MNRIGWPVIVASLTVAAGMVGSSLLAAARPGSAWPGLGASAVMAAATIAGVLIMVLREASAYPAPAVTVATALLVVAILVPATLSLAGTVPLQPIRHVSLLGACGGMFVVTLASRGCGAARPGWVVITTGSILASGLLIASLLPR